jgi:hypothetical protein
VLSIIVGPTAVRPIADRPVLLAAECFHSCAALITLKAFNVTVFVVYFICSFYLRAVLRLRHWFLQGTNGSCIITCRNFFYFFSLHCIHVSRSVSVYGGFFVHPGIKIRGCSVLNCVGKVLCPFISWCVVEHMLLI